MYVIPGKFFFKILDSSNSEASASELLVTKNIHQNPTSLMGWPCGDELYIWQRTYS